MLGFCMENEACLSRLTSRVNTRTVLLPDASEAVPLSRGWLNPVMTFY